MKPSMTANEVIRSWIKDSLSFHGEFTFSSVHIQSQVVSYGTNRGIYHTPDMYSRQWRKIREGIRNGKDYGFVVEEIEKKGKVVKWYRVTKN